MSSSSSCRVSASAFVALVMVSSSVVVVVARMAYELPAGSDLILNSAVKTTFSCDNRIYGYYADVDNDCQLFHVCYPINDEANKASYFITFVIFIYYLFFLILIIYFFAARWNGPFHFLVPESDHFQSRVADLLPPGGRVPLRPSHHSVW
jgi:hypothetical protein